MGVKSWRRPEPDYDRAERAVSRAYEALKDELNASREQNARLAEKIKRLKQGTKQDGHKSGSI